MEFPGGVGVDGEEGGSDEKGEKAIKNHKVHRGSAEGSRGTNPFLCEDIDGDPPCEVWLPGQGFSTHPYSRPECHLIEEDGVA